MQPGDIIVGDLKGVVVVPRDFAVELLERLVARTAAEADYTAAISRGDFSNEWVDRILEESDVTVVEYRAT